MTLVHGCSQPLLLQLVTVCVTFSTQAWGYLRSPLNGKQPGLFPFPKHPGPELWRTIDLFPSYTVRKLGVTITLLIGVNWRLQWAHQIPVWLSHHVTWCDWHSFNGVTVTPWMVCLPLLNRCDIHTEMNHAFQLPFPFHATFHIQNECCNAN